jgi:hypothetical protein
MEHPTPSTHSAPTSPHLDIIPQATQIADSACLELLGLTASLDAIDDASDGDGDSEEGKPEPTSLSVLLLMTNRYRLTEHIDLSTWPKTEAVEEDKENKVEKTRVPRATEETKALLEEPKEPIHLFSQTEFISPENQPETQELLGYSSTSTSTSEEQKSPTLHSTPEYPGASTNTFQGVAEVPHQTKDGVNLWWLIGAAVGVVALTGSLLKRWLW